VVILRRRLKEGLAVSGRDDAGQLALGFVEIGEQSEVYEYGVLVTSLDGEVLTLAQFYRDRADSELAIKRLKTVIGLKAPPGIDERSAKPPVFTGAGSMCWPTY